MTELHHNLKDEIIAASRGVFSRFGFQKTTMEEIAKAIKKGKSSIYYYFKSKEAIFQAIIEKESDLLNDELVKAISKEEIAENKIRVYFMTRARMIQKFANLHTTLTDEYYKNYSFIEDVREKYHQQEMNTMVSILEEGTQTGEFKLDDEKLTAFAIMMAFRGMEYPWAKEQNTSSLNKKIDMLLKILFNGIKAK